jgi:hypothetical protein
MKKFAKKLSLEGAYFRDLQALVEEAMTYALENIHPAALAAGSYSVTVLADAFCELQDKEMANQPKG